ncbi:hypothetical protein MNEG_2186 [Monoraphidium neglectum]|uniref:Uncharacterized protein n=1 Tax=Monoraphidium neglectum TaxID=145388 RepID=A0A0D2MT74_9CHLO|nr:hypothetical protein MNEG_2186 [Monoraphidium neglectum]KIZ05775.1 hypothetical protein MNEG_2186 [Monoraphidium neglectum]|eukprot:XP_013904794.1 hypothetical protein MNEG_2186 [Monoraphidium neglectum]
MADSAKVQLTRWVDSQDDLCDEDKVAMTLVFINVDDATCQAYMAMDERRRKAILKTAAADHAEPDAWDDMMQRLSKWSDDMVSCQHCRTAR